MPCLLPNALRLVTMPKGLRHDVRMGRDVRRKRSSRDTANSGSRWSMKITNSLPPGPEVVSTRQTISWSASRSVATRG
jgi:hypothetical protein